MIGTKNKISRSVPLRGSSTPRLAVTGSGEANGLSLVVRKHIIRHCVTLTSFIPAGFILTKDEQEQNNKNHLSLKGVNNK